MLENQLKELEGQEIKRKIVVMHYSPIRQTLEGESPEIWPFLGSSRFVEPIEAYEATAVFHGHAHHGTHQGTTPKGVRVYNVAYPLMQKTNSAHPFAIIEI
jgi:Icc-related predicted phosphoesterase